MLHRPLYMESQPVMRPALSPSQSDGESSQERYQHEYDRQKYDRIVTVPAAKSKPPFNASDGQFGLRQPIEHPVDKPPDMQHDHYFGPPQNKPSSILHTPFEYRADHPHYPTPRSAMEQSKQRVTSWCINENEESFVLDENIETLADEGETTYGESDHVARRNTDGSITRRIGDNQDSSDEETGLRKSMIGIQSPPGIISTSSACSRQSSSGSQSSLDSSLSFYTIYPSDGFQRKPQQKRQEDFTRPQQQPRTPIQYPAEHQQQTSTKSPGTVSTEPYFGHSQSHPGGAYGVNRPSGQSRVRQINQNADAASRQEREQKPTSVFITYAEEQQNSSFKKLVLQLTRTLLNNGIQVRLDMLESTLMSMSVNSWLDDNIQKCDFVIVCVSQSYKSEVEQQVLSDAPDPHSLHTRYIYNRLLTEYIQNGSRNYRFIPVLMGGATRRDLPSLCLDTTVYEWPAHYESIIYRLFKKEKYIQPRVGPPPRCTVETYGSQGEGPSGQ